VEVDVDGLQIVEVCVAVGVCVRVAVGVCVGVGVELAAVKVGGGPIVR
jgi:hypothetical protein